MNTDEATVNPDGSSSYHESSSSPPLNDTYTTSSSEGGGGFDAGFDGSSTGGAGAGAGAGGEEGFDLPPVMEDIVGASKGGLDPAVYLVLAFAIICGLYYYYVVMRKKEEESEDDFFSSIDCDKFDLKLPSEVDEYYKIRAKCEEAGWEPGKGPSPDAAQNPNNPHRMLAQALMKRAIADIPSVMKIQRESSGMSKLYARSMCSVKQWRSYQAAEALIAQEVADVKAEADDIEPGWSNGIWQQASQYHAMLKKKHEMELQAAQEKVKQLESKSAGGAGNKAGGKGEEVDDAKARELAAQKAAEELIREEEKEKSKNNKKAFASGMKKGFMESGNKGSKKK